MALRNPKLFGLNVFSALADVVDKEQSLNSLNLSSRDLDIIRGSQNAGASSGDWISFSRLIDPLYRTLDRYKTDSEAYGTLLDARAGTERTLFGNLNIVPNQNITVSNIVCRTAITLPFVSMIAFLSKLVKK